MQKTSKRQGVGFSSKLDNYMVKHRLPTSMIWAGILAVLWAYFMGFLRAIRRVFGGKDTGKV